MLEFQLHQKEDKIRQTQFKIHYLVLCPMMCLCLSGCHRGPHSPKQVCAAHTKVRDIIVTWLPESVGLKVLWVQLVTLYFTVQITASEVNQCFKTWPK